jgi:KUP system potassium uptake protein
LYFLTLASIGIYNIVVYDSAILLCFNPILGLRFLFSRGGFKVLSSVVLCVTGAEAVSADLGHFSKIPIWLSWYLLVFPCLLLNYLGQGAYMLGQAEASLSNVGIFFRSVPSSVYVPVWIIVTLATIVASQAMITGCFSLVSQGVALDLLPRLKTVNTDPEKKAQIFIPSVTAFLGLGTLALVLTFRNSAKLAGAYGISVLFWSITILYSYSK